MNRDLVHNRILCVSLSVEMVVYTIILRTYEEFSSPGIFVCSIIMLYSQTPPHVLDMVTVTAE